MPTPTSVGILPVNLDDAAHVVAAQEKHEVFGAIFIFRRGFVEIERCTSAVMWCASIDHLRELLP